MQDRFKFRAGFTVSYTDDNEDDREIQLFIKGYFSVDNGGEGIVVHSSIIDEALNNTNLSLNEKKSVVNYIEVNYCETDGYWFIDNLDFLEQCTGLKDKNGKLIYEGDFLRDDDYPFNNNGIDNYFTEVCWDEHYAEFFCYVHKYLNSKISGISEGSSYSLNDYEWEIIGNIHENADLLEK